MTDDIKGLRESLEGQLKEGFTSLQQKYDAVSEEPQNGSTASGELKAQIENQKGELERVIEQVQKLEEKGVKLRGNPGEKKSFIDLVKGHDDYKSLMDQKQQSA